MIIHNKKEIQINGIQFSLDNDVVFNLESSVPVKFHYAEFRDGAGRMEYYENGVFKLLKKLTLDEFKGYIPEYDDIIKQGKLLELNEFNEPKYKEVDDELVEQTEPSQDFIKNKLLTELEAYYEDCKNISITIDNKTITHRFDSKWRTLLHSKITSLQIATQLNKPENIFTWLANGVTIILNVEQLEQLMYTVEQEIIQPNYNSKLAETSYISNNDVALDYDFKKNFLHNQTINL
jgi:predicted DNA-binding antitoxin AbrB/MazE fold protein